MAIHEGLAVRLLTFFGVSAGDFDGVGNANITLLPVPACINDAGYGRGKLRAGHHRRDQAAPVFVIEGAEIVGDAAALGKCFTHGFVNILGHIMHVLLQDVNVFGHAFVAGKIMITGIHHTFYIRTHPWRFFSHPNNPPLINDKKEEEKLFL